MRVDMPEMGKLLFQNWYKQFPAPYFIYADTEAKTTKIEGPSLIPAIKKINK